MISGVCLVLVDLLSTLIRSSKFVFVRYPQGHQGAMATGRHEETVYDEARRAAVVNGDSGWLEILSCRSFTVVSACFYVTYLHSVLVGLVSPFPLSDRPLPMVRYVWFFFGGTFFWQRSVGAHGLQSRDENLLNTLGTCHAVECTRRCSLLCGRTFTGEPISRVWRFLLDTLKADRPLPMVHYVWFCFGGKVIVFFLEVCWAPSNNVQHDVYSLQEACDLLSSLATDLFSAAWSMVSHSQSVV